MFLEALGLTHVVVESFAVVRRHERVTPRHEEHVQVARPLDAHLLQTYHRPLRYLDNSSTQAAACDTQKTSSTAVVHRTPAR